MSGRKNQRLQAVESTVECGAFGVRRGQVQILINTCVYKDSGEIVLLVTVHSAP